MTPGRLVTLTGLLRLVKVPSPSCPLLFSPQLQTVPSALRARMKLPGEGWATSPPPPPAMAMAPERLETGPGVALSMSVPLPSCPYWLPPQARGIPAGTAAAGAGRRAETRRARAQSARAGQRRPSRNWWSIGVMVGDLLVGVFVR